MAINPNLKHLKKVPPHHWKLVAGKIEAMNDIERHERDVAIRDSAPDSRIDVVEAIKKSIKPEIVEIEKVIEIVKKEVRWQFVCAGSFLGLILGVIIGRVI